MAEQDVSDRLAAIREDVEDGTTIEAEEHMAWLLAHVDSLTKERDDYRQIAQEQDALLSQLKEENAGLKAENIMPDHLPGTTLNSLLRELENQLAAVQISVKAGILPHAGINCARQIMSELLASIGFEPTAGLPDIDPDETEL